MATRRSHPPLTLVPQSDGRVLGDAEQAWAHQEIRHRKAAGARTGDERTPTPALEALATLARRSAPPATPALLGRGWLAVATRLAGRATRRRALLRWSAVVAGGALLTIAGLAASSRRPVQPAAPIALSYRVEGGRVSDGGFLEEAGDAGVKLRFAEGTEFVLRSGTRGRLRSVDGAGARIAIEHGTASFRVTPRVDANWMVDVGPFLVKVKGTAFIVSWDASSEQFELTVKHGRVVVMGPVSHEGVTLQTGQRLAVDLPKKQTRITEQRPQAVW